MEDTTNIVVYYNSEVVRNTYEGVSFACVIMFSFVVLCTITFAKLQYGLCQSIEADILKRVTNILYKSLVVIFGDQIQFEILPIIDESNVPHDRTEAYLRMIDDSDVEFEATYKAGDEDQDVSQPMDVSPFMRSLDFDAMYAPKFFEYINEGQICFLIAVADPEDGEFRIEMEYSSRKSVIATIRSYTISRGVNYVIYESEPQTFYTRCKTYGREYDWLI
ncbi:hypothetical protein Ahy_A07g032053 [Arachis hypogaea]|uniref:Uncharacterized protein n=1 Tax=Arachis hypogaea TaxID=3818 RepID=A0A445C5T9_ARAHY|nr:hypothetical protein Ahy_A07g032053 [Arachis hypogaea]